jgi:hypothetical protein
MMEFLASIGLFGWVLIGFVVICLIRLPKWLRDARAARSIETPPMVGQPPDYRGPPGGGAV